VAASPEQVSGGPLGGGDRSGRGDERGDLWERDAADHVPSRNVSGSSAAWLASSYAASVIRTDQARNTGCLQLPVLLGRSWGRGARAVGVGLGVGIAGLVSPIGVVKFDGGANSAEVAGLGAFVAARVRRGRPERAGAH